MTDKIVDVVAEIPFREFIVPNFATITDGENNISVPLPKLKPDAIDQLVGVWLERVYAKCNRDMPWSLPEDADKLPAGVAEALGPERDWADELAHEVVELALSDNTDWPTGDVAGFLRTRCRPIGNDTVTDEAIEAALCNVFDHLDITGWARRDLKSACRKHFAGLTFPEATQ